MTWGGKTPRRLVFAGVLSVLVLVACGSQQKQAPELEDGGLNAIAEPFRSSLDSDSQVFAPGIELVVIGAQRYAIASSTVKTSDFPPTSDQRRVGEIKAKRRFVSFVSTQIESQTTVTATQTYDSAKKKARYDESFSSWTIERANGVVRNAKVIGVWPSADGDEFFTAIAIPID